MILVVLVIMVPDGVLLQPLDGLLDCVDSMQTVITAPHHHSRSAQALPERLLKAAHLALQTPSLTSIVVGGGEAAQLLVDVLELRVEPGAFLFLRLDLLQEA